MTKELRTAEAGDICALLYPDPEEFSHLRSEQESLVKAFGGWVVPEPHITLQRFRIERDPLVASSTRGTNRLRPFDLNIVMEGAQQALSRLAPFPVYANGLTQFLAPFWGTYVLRWEVQRDLNWSQLIRALDESLQSNDCELHYSHEITPTCSAVDLTRPVKMDEAQLFAFPRPLFTARRVLFTGGMGLNDFETLGMAKIGLT